jgi:hypothetical protein
MSNDHRIGVEYVVFCRVKQQLLDYYFSLMKKKIVVNVIYPIPISFILIINGLSGKFG